MGASLIDFSTQVQASIDAANAAEAAGNHAGRAEAATNALKMLQSEYDALHRPTPSAEPKNGVEAAARLAHLESGKDQDFTRRFAAGDSAARQEIDKLTKQAADADPVEMAIAGVAKPADGVDGRTLVAGAALPAMPQSAWAQAHPTRPVRIIVGFAAGASTDLLARLIGQRLSEQLGQQFVIENRPGARGNISTEAVVNAPPDGYTLLLVNPANAINATLYDKLNFNFIRDIAPVGGLSREANVLVVNPSVPAKAVPEFIAYAKANPAKVNMASGGNGTFSHMAGELFKMMAGVNMVHVPYRGGGPALADLLGGQVQVNFASMPGSIEYIRAGKLRALAVTTATRSEALPDIPKVADFVPGYEITIGRGSVRPRTRLRKSLTSSTGK
jgi:tripartite-type tricarboxylate transporter receptor subunit TctC